MTVNQIGDDGANAISGLLKTNTALNILYAGCLEEVEKGLEREDQTHGNENEQAVELEKKERNQ